MLDFFGWLKNENDARTLNKVQTMKHYFPYIQKIPDNIDRIRAQHFLTNADFKSLLGLLNKYGINVVSTVLTGKSFISSPASTSTSPPAIGPNPFGENRRQQCFLKVNYPPLKMVGFLVERS